MLTDALNLAGVIHKVKTKRSFYWEFNEDYLPAGQPCRLPRFFETIKSEYEQKRQRRLIDLEHDDPDLFAILLQLSEFAANKGGAPEFKRIALAYVAI